MIINKFLTKNDVNRPVCTYNIADNCYITGTLTKFTCSKLWLDVSDKVITADPRRSIFLDAALYIFPHQKIYYNIDKITPDFIEYITRANIEYSEKDADVIIPEWLLEQYPLTIALGIYA